MQHSLLIGTGLLISCLSLASCGSGSSGGSSGPTTGRFSLGVTDAPVDHAEKVLVQFTGVTVKPKEGAALELDLTGDSQTCEDLRYGNNDPSPTPAGEPTVRCIDLLTLQGTESENLLANVTLDAGEYNWIRLDVDADRGTLDSIIQLIDRSWESLYIPSGSQSGLKLNSGFTILAGGSHQFVIDFDLRKSVNNPQGFPDYRLKPSLRLIDMAESGNITGTVAASLLSADNCTSDAYAVYVYQGAGATVGDEGSANAPLTSAAVTLQGNEWQYTAGFLAPGDYEVAFTCEAANDTETPDEDIDFISSPDSPTTVIADQDSVVNF
jgi:uncharacterized protein DUF4382